MPSTDSLLVEKHTESLLTRAKEVRWLGTTTYESAAAVRVEHVTTWQTGSQGIAEPGNSKDPAEPGPPSLSL